MTSFVLTNNIWLSGIKVQFSTDNIVKVEGIFTVLIFISCSQKPLYDCGFVLLSEKSKQLNLG